MPSQTSAVGGNAVQAPSPLSPHCRVPAHLPTMAPEPSVTWAKHVVPIFLAVATASHGHVPNVSPTLSGLRTHWVVMVPSAVFAGAQV